MNKVNRDSEWRKWDLHIHTPKTKLANGYSKVGGEVDWDRFCKVIHDSDVEAFGVTDYFSLNSFFEFKEKYKEKYPEDRTKIFFPNLELRLNQAVHHSGSFINIHAIFRPDLTEVEAQRLHHNIKLVNTDSGGKRASTCADLQNWDKNKIDRATVDINDLIAGIKESFDDIDDITDVAIIIVSGRNDGLSPGKFNSPRNYSQIDEIDKVVHGFFARAKDADHWLDPDRLDETHLTIPPKPTFGGCDAHDFDMLEKMLGKTGINGSRVWQTTWIKADLSY